MGEGHEAISLEVFKAQAERAGLQLDDEKLAQLKPGFDFSRAEADALREADLSAIEPAHTFNPDWK